MGNYLDKSSLKLNESRFKPEDLDLVERAREFAERAHAGQTRKSGEPYLTHPVAVAQTLADMGLDAEAIAAALLHDTIEDCEVKAEELADQFDQTVTGLVEGVTKLGQVDFAIPAEEANRQAISAENLRKLLLAMSKDLRVILIKLADRLHNLETIKHLDPDAQQKMARESLEIYAPLADRLGMGEMKARIEDLAFKVVSPAAYQETRQTVDKQVKDTARYLAKLKRFTADELAAAGIKVVMIEARQKHIYSVFKKLAKVEGDIEKIYDIMALRIIVPTESDCYQALGVIHQHLKPLIHRIKDYIAVPKPNGYRSLHTTVFALDGHITEIQIRTPRMHEEAEHGLAAHFYYDAQKTTKHYHRGRASEVPKRLAWVNQLTDLHQQAASGTEMVEALKIDLFVDRIFVFSPKGDLYDLPEGATPLDFSFAVHSDLGLRTAGAKVNGRIVPLDHRLENRDVVEILTKREPSPKRDWLGVVKTAAARNRIRSWFRAGSRASNLALGKGLVEQNLKAWELKRVEELPKERVKQLLEQLPYKTLDDVLAAVGEGQLSVHAVTRHLFPPAADRPAPKVVAHPPATATGKLLIAQERDLPYTLAACCKPVYPVAVVGYVTRGKGVTIHACTCPNLPSEADRLLECRWEMAGVQIKCTIAVTAANRLGLLRDITGAISGFGVNITAVHSREVKQRTEAIIEVEVEVVDLFILAALIKKLEHLPGVLEVQRSA